MFRQLVSHLLKAAWCYEIDDSGAGAERWLNRVDVGISFRLC